MLNTNLETSDPARLASLSRRLAATRAQSLALALPLSEADCQVQSMPDASPVKWHLAHTTWFFETFVLERHEPGFQPHHAAFRVLFNSYYNGIGEQFARPQRGLVTRPSLAEVLDYRRAVDERLAALLERLPPAQVTAVAELVELGVQHEQQHQELILTDVQHLLSCNPLAPVYAEQAPLVHPIDSPQRWVEVDGGLVHIGHDADAGAAFAFDNETPRHAVYLRRYALARGLVTQGQWQAFIDAGGYTDPRWWLAAGWDWVRQQRIVAPLYWQRDGAGGWTQFTLRGRRALELAAPVLHLSFYEADAYARWHAAQHPGQSPTRLPTEAEWEHAVAGACGCEQAFGHAWQWTASSYAAYPGFRAWDGAVGEYNAKFMVDQYVLRGSSIVTPDGHARVSYRNFFPAPARWQFTGLRLARDLD